MTLLKETEIMENISCNKSEGNSHSMRGLHFSARIADMCDPEKNKITDASNEC